MPTKTSKKSGKSTEPLVTGDMLIGEVLNLYPDTAEIMQDFGLHCTSCSVNVFEPLKAGAMSHGIEEEVVDEMILRINELAASKRKAPDDGIYVTQKAAEKIREFAKAEDKEGYGLRISAKDNGGREPVYAMDFLKDGEAGDTRFEFHGVTIHLDPESLGNLLGAEVDFIESAYGSGFKITNPRFTKKGGGCGCGSGGGGCGC
ncbi:iron-sulfur cluster assembly accessory protein [Candidatus Peregrinibacteria bacterium]|nr:MAG: iron-sulfur cluster assembly accessory protein [Candidatus Peregrinibacteria bacterium]